jgi:hypothetical protein
MNNEVVNREGNQLPQQPEDPFNEYSDYSTVPDVPLQQPLTMVDSLINDNEVPEEFKQEHWWAFHKDNSLTFLDEERKKSKLLNLDILKIDALNRTPYYKYDWEMEMDFSILRQIFETKLDRATGFKGGNIKNERILLQSQFTESRQINDNGDQGGVQGSFVKRLLGRGR